jgi:hypothetical protein
MNANPLAVIVLAIMWVRFYPGTSYLLIAVLAASAVVQAVMRSRRTMAARRKDAAPDLGAWEQYRRVPDEVIEARRHEQEPEQRAAGMEARGG